VSTGERIGRMGHSGRSGGPHLHIQADRVKPEFLGDLPKLMALIKADETVSVFRPMQFHGAKAMQTSLGVKPGGAAANPLAEMKGHGAFFEEYVVLPDAP
ncbi:MAG TPA: M23 family metallopeptidase, partial [Polyangiaceae bacterium]|nr:M23 family metallopeptidase [Polyangiaceae bacterium]